MSKLLGYWPGVVMLLWLFFITAVAGYTAAVFSGVTGLAVCLVAFWEAGARKSTPCPPTGDDRG